MVPPRDQRTRIKEAEGIRSQRLERDGRSDSRDGCQLKDVEIGLVDFPTLYRGKEVYLCWKFGEAGIGYWHPIEDGYRGRQRPSTANFRQIIAETRSISAEAAWKAAAAPKGWPHSLIPKLAFS